MRRTHAASSLIPAARRAELSRALAVIERLYRIEPWSRGMDSFEILVGTVLSQNTNDRNSMLAFRRLKKRFKIRPEVLANAKERDIVECIRPAGLHNMKAPRIKSIAQELLEKYDGKLDDILRLPEAEARTKLLGLPGVGFKTADVLLAFVAGRNVLPVDTHIARIAKRIGIVDAKAEYEETRSALESLVSSEKRGRTHLALIKIGRTICKARKPLCPKCPILRFCAYPAKTANIDGL